MPRYIVKEGMIEKFLTKVFTSVLKGKQRAMLKAIEKDPELKKLTKDAQQGLEDLNSYISKRKKQGKVVGAHVPDSIKDLYK